MLEGRKDGSTSSLPVRIPRKSSISLKISTARIQTGCLDHVENSIPYCRGQIGRSQNRLVNRFKKTVLPEFKQSQTSYVRLLNQNTKATEISKSAPELSREGQLSRPKMTSLSSVATNLQKINSSENMTKPRKVSDIKNQPTSRIPTKPPVDPGKQRSSRELLISKSKQLDLRKTTVAENSRAGNPAGDKRKFGCIENLPDRSKGQKAASVTSGVSQILTSKCRTEECKKIIKNIMSDNRFVDTGEKKRSSAEFEDSLETFNSEEMTDFLLGDVPVRSPETGKLNCETDKSSKRNSSEFDDSIGSFFSDQMVLTMSKSNEFINMTGSKQSFLNENPLGLSYPEGLDNLTPGLSGLSNPVDRTPSGEDLPMECEVEPESGNSAVPGPSEATTSRRYTSPAEELPQESLSSRTSNAPMSIITSITSIMSLDTGYQGDGELSRPESRNTENESRLLKLPIAENGLPVKGINFDDGKTMTDSDFFTESDVDVHDDLSAAAAEIGSGKGDRKAQVIDGTLYGGAFIQSHVTAHNVNENVASVSGQQSSKLVLATNNSNEDMESSGIYSDLERKPEEIRLKEKESISCMNMITEQIKTIQSLAQSVAQKRLRHGPSADGIVKRCSTQDSVSTVYEELHATAPPAGQQSVNRTVGQSETSNSVSVLKNPPNKKPKIYNRTVLKNSLFSMGRENLKKEPEVGVKAVKRGKWDSVMNKIAQGKEENKHAPSKFRDVKSKVFENMGPTINAKRITSDKKVPGKMSPGSQLKSRSRRSTRVRSSESSLVSPKSKQSRTSTSLNSSQRSSLSDISLSVTPHAKTTTRSSKKREVFTPNTNESTNSTRKPHNKDVSLSKTNSSTIPGGNYSEIQNGNLLRTPSGTTLPTMKTPTIKKTPTPRRGDSVGSTLHRTANVPFKDSNHNGVVSKSGSAVIINNNTSQNNNNNNNHHNVKTANSYQNNKTLKGTTRVSNPVQMKNGSLLAAAKEANKALLRQLKHNVRAFESLAILFSYCANDLDAFSTPQLKQQLETERGKFVQAQSDIEELQSKLIRIREELNDKELIITELSNDKVSLVEESGNFRKLVEELQNKLKIVTEQKCEAETELLKECENIRCLKRELSNRTDKYENEKENLSGCLTEAKRENGILKSANREIREEYNKCLLENQRLVEVISRRQNEKVDKENWDGEEISRTRQKVPERSPERFPITPAASEKSFWNQANNSPIPVNPKCLESEVESLRQVLALKTDEVTELRRQELSLRENADRVPKLLSTITMLEGKVEDLQSQLSSQTETVRDLFKSNEHLEDELKSASIQRTRLTQKNEELQYKLKQYAEAMKQLATQNLSEKTIKPEISPIKANYKKSEGGLEECITPHMKAVVEKSDSVSYMLEMMEDSSEIVTNIIKRAESLRSTSRDQVLGKKRRPKVSSVGSNETTSTKRNLSVEDDFRPGIMSTPNLSPNEYETERHRHHHQNATSLSRQHSYNINKAVKLSQEDFATDSIDLGSEDCEIIEITKCFYKTDKNGEMVTSTSSSSSSSSNGSHFDIESDVFSNSEDREANIQEVEEYGAEPRENGHSVIRTYRRETENLKPVLPVYKDLDGSEEARTRSNGSTQNGGSESFVKIPKISGGEAMVGLSSDEEDIEKLNRICNE